MQFLPKEVFMYSREELLCGQINTGNNPAFMKHTQAEPEMSAFLLVVGIGGTGIKAVRRAAGRLRREMTDRSHVSFLAIDRDHTELEGLEEEFLAIDRDHTELEGLEEEFLAIDRGHTELEGL